MVLHAVELRKDGHDSSLEKRIDPLRLREEELRHLSDALEQLSDQVLQVGHALGPTKVTEQVERQRR